MRGGVVTHDVVAAWHVHFGQGFIANFGLAGDHFAHMNDDAGRGFAHFSYFYLPLWCFDCFRSALSAQRGADVTGITHLAAGFDVKAGFGQDNIDSIAEGNGNQPIGRLLPAPGFHLRASRAGVRLVFDAVGAEFFVGLQGFEHTGVEFGVFAAQRAHGFAAARSDAMLVHGGAEAGFVHVQILFAGDVAG